MANQIICDHCGTQNRVGTLFCDDCGVNLIDHGYTEPITLPARKMKTISQPLNDLMMAIPEDMPISLYIRGWQDPLVIERWNRATLGRLDSNSARKPDLDLSPFGAREKGVSRIHAMFERKNKVPAVIDMNSRNGVYINGERIKPGMPFLIHDGDELHLGELIAHVYFG